MWTVSLGSLGGVSQSVANQVLAVAQAAANYWGRHIDASLASIDIEITFAALPLTVSDSAVDLAFSHSSAGVDYYEPVAVKELKTGVDANGAAADFTVIIDTLTLSAGEFTFSSLINGISPGGGGGLDLWTVIVHEIGHGLGFETLIGSGSANRTTFDQFVTSVTSGFVFDGSNPDFGPIGLDDDDIRHIGPSFRSVLGSNLNPGEALYLSDVDLAILTDLGVPLVQPSAGDDVLMAFRHFLPGFPITYGLEGNDTLIGLPTNDYLSGDEGDDLLAGGAGRDTLFGGDGDDTIEGGNDGESLYGGFGFDTADYSGMPMSLYYLQNITWDTAPTYDGVSGTWQFMGNSIDNFGEIESIVGTRYADIIVLSGAQAIFGGAGSDIIDAIGVTNDTIDGGDGNDTIRADFGEDLLLGGAGYDSILGEFGDDSIDGGGADDTLIGATGFDNIFGGKGNDFISGGADSDTLSGGAGHDSQIGEDGNDLLAGGDGADTLSGGAGNDRFFGDAQRDLIFGDSDDDIIDAGTGDDTVDGGNQRDSVFGGSGFDLIDGGNGNDTLTGGTGGDTLLGGAGFDILQGDAGDDVLNGGASNDVIFGNAGNDTIIFELGGGTDTLRDFTASAASEDVINLVGFGAAFDTFGEVIAAATQTGAHVTIDFGGGDMLVLRNVLVSELHADDFSFG
ncbi:MAG: calcium-binding protein [Pseudomonadota bacterium]